MADPAKSVAENVPGEFFVDSTCIDCDTCRQLAPEVFGAAAQYAFVRRQPRGDGETRRALQALVSCPTGSIGSRGPASAKSVLDDFPLPLEGPVYYCGLTLPNLMGATATLCVGPTAIG